MRRACGRTDAETACAETASVERRGGIGAGSDQAAPATNMAAQREKRRGSMSADLP
ncbi:hypothetical protein Ga0080559_TMP3246 [Salipiger profundus]|uniref:Uncharacterized protein n=1 Tax=Salipiger profundus TaxID=1229727 RepID=A0A1U7D7F5_9RHOB|nr:hypothetical protein Ga0080559_TMP3246 [Salipiger profundus]